jgi:hypothetical protein
VSRIQGTCSKGTDETVLTKFVMVTDGQTGQKQYIITVYMEHYELKCDQFTVGSDHRGRFITFTGRSTKTYKGGLKDLELKNKKITRYCQEGKTFSVLLLHIIARVYMVLIKCRGYKVHVVKVLTKDHARVYKVLIKCRGYKVHVVKHDLLSVPLLHVPCILDT